ncbi:MAG: NnrS family protein [Marinicaulis sp.]|nr:NnrS family protein [Marinicaulis sp.]
MPSKMSQLRAFQGLAFFSFGFRPFFLCGSVVATILPIVTGLSLVGLNPFSHPVGAIGWHAHEMLFGYLAAVIAGFVLTAVPNWTGRLPIIGWRLALLFMLWASGRAIMLSALGGAVSAIVDVSFLLLIDIVLWREVIAGKNWRNVPVCVLIGLFAIGNLLWHIDIIEGGSGSFGLRFGLAVIAVLLALIGGRVTPSFTRNWFAKNNLPLIDASFLTVDIAAIGCLIFAVAAWLLAPGRILTGIALILASLLHIIRLFRWKGWRTKGEPLLTILHIGYFWFGLALFLMGVSALAPSLVSQSTGIHVLTAGATGVMTLAVMTRATLGHTGRELTADTATVMIYTLVNLGAGIRLAAPYASEYYTITVAAAGAVWGGAFFLFTVVYGRYLVAPRLESP